MPEQQHNGSENYQNAKRLERIIGSPQYKVASSGSTVEIRKVGTPHAADFKMESADWLMSDDQIKVRLLDPVVEVLARVSIPPETGALVPPHPQMYDITKDEMRPVAQEDYDLASNRAEADALRTALIRRLIGWDRDKLRQLRKLIDDNFSQTVGQR